jgi:hypothetical protein
LGAIILINLIVLMKSQNSKMVQANLKLQTKIYKNIKTDSDFHQNDVFFSVILNSIQDLSPDSDFHQNDEEG